MTTATITLVSICAGGDHVAFDGSIAGGPSIRGNYTVDELREALTADTGRDLLRLLVQLHCRGMTKNQTRNAVTAGITITTAAT
jgi:hypothetical protein